MTEESAVRMANELMNRHNLHEWKFGFSRSNCTAGICYYYRKEIRVSRSFCRLNDETTMRDLLLHEIAHALAGPEHGHDEVWKKKCVEIGAKPERCYKNGDVNLATGKYCAHCPACGQVFHKFYKPSPKRDYWCKKCGPDSKLSWSTL